MTRFHAEYVDAIGISRIEDIDAESREAALATLDSNRPWVRSLRPDDVPSDGLPGVVASLATLVDRGVPLTPALCDVAASASTDALRESLAKAAAMTEEGLPLTDALGAVGGPLAEPAFVELVRTGEGTGALGGALLEVGALAARLESARAAILGRLTYPALLLCSAALLVGAVSAASGPTAKSLVEFLATTEWRVPFFLRLLALSADWATVVWGVVGLTCVGVLALLRSAHRASPYAPSGLLGQSARDALSLRLLSALVARAVPLPQAWAALRCSVGTQSAQAAAHEGQDATTTFEAAGVVTPAERLGLEAAQRAGPDALADELKSVASAREIDARRRAERLALWIEVGIEVGVGLLLVAVAMATLPSGYGVGP